MVIIRAALAGNLLKIMLLGSVLLNLALAYGLYVYERETNKAPALVIDAVRRVQSTQSTARSDNLIVDSIRAELELERMIRIDLEGEITILRQELALLLAEEKNNAIKGKDNAQELVSIPERLAAIGIDQYVIDSIVTQHDQYTLQRLEVINRLGRASGQERRELGKQVITLQQDLKSTLGDQQYDYMLYATQ